ncbi:MAG TPA: helicase, partial [Alphaproteobacteria bacterium]
GGTDAKALSAAAQKALSGEIETRANKLAHAPDSQFVLTSDATIRWIGEPVAKILAGDTVLRPRVRILADEQLTGASLEAAQIRLDLWTRTHIERLLAPLFVLGAAEDITGLARGIAYQLVEALGVLERSKVADDLKSLDQDLRAVLRRHGVRFGAYHVYVPLLLKPAPRALAAQLWALKHGGPDIKGLDELQRLASSGRTSFPVDKEVQRSFYRTIGYRVCGERAVRVDILERLADLVRPALSWRPGSAAPQPAGAFEGIGFTVTQAMTSLTGSSGEDFASILRALGYRMERRPKPVKVVAEAETLPAPDTAAPTSDQPATGLEPVVDTVTDPPLQAEGEMVADGAQVDQGPAPHDSTSPGMTLQVSGDSAATAAIAGDQGASDPARPAADEATAVAEAGTPDAPTASSGGATVDPELPQVPAATAEPELIDVWRPGGRSEERRGQRRPPQWQRTRQGHDRAPAGNATEERAVAAAADGAEPVVEAATPIEKKAPRHRGPRGGPQGEFRRERDDGGERRQRDHRAEHRSERQGDRPERARGDRPHFAKGRTEHKDR